MVIPESTIDCIFKEKKMIYTNILDIVYQSQKVAISLVMDTDDYNFSKHGYTY